MNYTPKKLSKKVFNKLSKKVPNSRKQSFRFIRDKEGLLLQEGRATCRGHDLSACERLHRDILQDLGESSGPGSSRIPGGIQGDEPLGYGDGLFTRIRLLEGLIHDLGLKDDSEGLRRVLKEYCEAWIELERGLLCKK